MDIDPRLADLEALVAAFEGQTAQQRELLTQAVLDTEKLSESLLTRRAVLEQMGAAFEVLTAEDGPETGHLLERLEAIQAMDDENIRLADSHAAALREQARQMTQTRKGVSTYGRNDLAGSESQFDKTQ